MVRLWLPSTQETEAKDLRFKHSLCVEIKLALALNYTILFKMVIGGGGGCTSPKTICLSSNFWASFEGKQEMTQTVQQQASSTEWKVTYSCQQKGLFYRCIRVMWDCKAHGEKSYRRNQAQECIRQDGIGRRYNSLTWTVLQWTLNIFMARTLYRSMVYHLS